MKLLVVADLHYRLKQFDWLEKRSEEYDAVVIAGDVLDLAGHAELDTQIVVVLKYLDRLRRDRPVVVCSGNHDGDVKNSHGEYVAEWLLEARGENLHVDGDTFQLGRNLVTVCPWWDGPVSRDELSRCLEEAGSEDRSRWIWVYHAPPDESPVSWSGKKFVGDPFLGELIGRHGPDIVLSGHIHNSPFYAEGSWVDRIGKTWVFNSGHQMAPEPSFISIDLEEEKARWVSLEESDEVDLGKPFPADSP